MNDDPLFGIPELPPLTDDGDTIDDIYSGIVLPFPQVAEGLIYLGYDRAVFYYLSRATRQVHALSADQHTKKALMCMASVPHYWQRTKHISAKGNIKWDDAIDAMMSGCRDVGIYDPERVRGRGVWSDNGRAVFHMGDRLIVNGIGTNLMLPGTKAIYPAALSLNIQPAEPLPPRDAIKLKALCEGLRWEKKRYGTLFAGWIVCAMICGALKWRPSVWLTGASGSGKAQPHSAKVLTSRGWRNMGDIRPGDTMATPDGGYGRVLSVYPQGKVPAFKVTFSDGRATRVTADHLWKVRVNGQWRLRTTTAIKDVLSEGKGAALALAVPLCVPQPLNVDKFTLPLPAYVVGVLLGDGYLGCDRPGKVTDIRVTSADPEIFARMREVLPPDITTFPTNKEITVRIGHLSRYGNQARPLVCALRDLAMLGKRSHEKSVPAPYLSATVLDRIELLKGLMDTDGTVDAQGTLSFCSVSKQLASDVQYLVRSLGGIAAIREKKTTFTTTEGDKKAGRLAYQVNIRLPQPTLAFSLPRKLERVNNQNQYADSFYLGIESIEPDGEEKASCIAIDHPDRLYITDDFVVTHNTWLLENVLTPLIGPIALNVMSKTTEAGIRQTLNSDALPVIFDEFESEDHTAATRVQGVLDLMRQSSSESDKKIIKGSQNQTAARGFRVRSCFIFSSVNVGVSHTADENRLSVLSLLPAANGDPEAARDFERLEAEAYDLISQDFAAGMLARAVSMVQVIRANAETFSAAVARRMGTRRLGDQLGTMLAGAHALWSNDVCSPEFADRWLAEQDWASDWGDVAGQTEPEEKRLLAHILSHRVRMQTIQDANGREVTVNLEVTLGRLVTAAFATEGTGDPAVNPQTAAVELQDYGMRILTAPDKVLLVSTNHPALARILKDTPWHANWSRSLGRLEGASSPRKNWRFGLAANGKAIRIPYSSISIDDGPDEC